MPLNPFAPEWRPSVLLAQAGVEANAAMAEPIDSFDLSGLPGEVVTLILSFLDNPRDLSNCITACTLLKRHANEAELRLDMRSSSIGRGNAEEITPSRLHAMLGFCKYIQGTVALLLPNVPLEDSDINVIIASLPRLQLLDISGGRKITHSSVSSLAHANSADPLRIVPESHATKGPQSSSPSCAGSNVFQQLGFAGTPSAETAPALSGYRLPPIRALNLQRCFQLHSRSLDELLRCPGLSVLALSHLDLGRWPSQDVEQTPQAPGTGPLGAGLQVLALNNCLRLHGAAIAALAAVSAADTAGECSSASDAPCGRSNVAFLLLGGSTLALASFVGSGSPAFLRPPRLAELLEQTYKPAVTSTSATVQAHLAAAKHLLAAVLAMPRLVALDLTFFPPPLVDCMRRVLSNPDATGRPPVEVWDFAGVTDDVPLASRTLRRHLEAGDGTAGRASLGRGVGRVDALAASMVLRCAVNCSSVTRSTPLHIAAERGYAQRAADLLAAGAVVDARDTAGSTPLFLASEAGHTAVLELLLAAGADLRLGNSAGETPLYIAALRGHLGCVRALLAICEARGIAWQDPELYGDAWTPLHAAAVANRADVAACLLQAAGTSGAGDLVVVPNKYGQSVLHIAARKGSSQLLRLLLSAGGVAVVGSRDGSGDTPVDVAKKNRHVAALAEFRRLTGGVGHVGARGQHSPAMAMA